MTAEVSARTDLGPVFLNVRARSPERAIEKAMKRLKRGGHTVVTIVSVAYDSRH